MAVRDRIRKYRTEGGAAEFVRVEVLVPPGGREAIVEQAAALRARHRQMQLIDAEVRRIVDLYGVRATDNIDLARLAEPAARARAVARGLMERGDARAFILARRLMAMADGGTHGTQ
jgi:hypothetical protein